jgi:hypothetical protein
MQKRLDERARQDQKYFPTLPSPSRPHTPGLPQE